MPLPEALLYGFVSSWRPWKKIPWSWSMIVTYMSQAKSYVVVSHVPVPPPQLCQLLCSSLWQNSWQEEPQGRKCSFLFIFKYFFFTTFFIYTYMHIWSGCGCECVFCLHVCLLHHLCKMPIACLGQKKALDPMEMEFLIGISHHVLAGNWRFSRRAARSKALLHLSDPRKYLFSITVQEDSVHFGGKHGG